MTVAMIAEVFPGADPDRVLLTQLRRWDTQSIALELRHTNARKQEPLVRVKLTKARGEGDAKAEKITRAKLAEIERDTQELPDAIKVARAHEKAARQALAEALLPESASASVGLAHKAEEAVQVLRDAVSEWAAGRRQHVTILQSVGQATLKNTRPPAAIGFTQPRGDLVSELLGVLLNPDRKWV